MISITRSIENRSSSIFDSWIVPELARAAWLDQQIHFLQNEPICGVKTTSGNFEALNEVKIAGVQLRLEDRGPNGRIMPFRGAGYMFVTIVLRRAEQGLSVRSRRTVVVQISGVRLRHNRVIAGEFEHKAMTVVM